MQLEIAVHHLYKQCLWWAITLYFRFAYRALDLYCGIVKYILNVSGSGPQFWYSILMLFAQVLQRGFDHWQNCFFMTSFNMQNKLHYQVPWLSFTEISLRTFWPLCKSSCDSFVLLQNAGCAETPNSTFGNIPSMTSPPSQWDPDQRLSFICTN